MSNDNKGKLATIKGKVGTAVDRTKAAISEAASSSEALAVVDWTKKAGAELKSHAVELGHSLQETDLGRTVTKGAIAGAVAGVPLPVIGPISGAVIGAAAGAYLNLKHGVGSHSKVGGPDSPHIPDTTVTETLSKLDQLRQEGVITDAEFQEQKAKLLKRI